MDDIARCKNQLASFRIKELKDVLSRLGLPKQGKKQVLMDKILAVLTPSDWQYPKGVKCKNSVSKEEAAKVIDDIYRKLRGPGAVELASGTKNVSLTPGTQLEVHDETASEVRCPCGRAIENETMIQCDNKDCGVWQHMDCVVIPEKVVEGCHPEVPNQFFCESCRISYGDPFCVTLSQPLSAVKLSPSPAMKLEGSNTVMHSVEKTFTLSKADREALHKPNHDLQVWCLLLNDKVPYRIHWPTYADLRVNGVPVRVTTRTGNQLLGINGRDDGPSVFTCTREGTNRVALSAYDARPFCVGVRIIRRRTVEQVLSMIPGPFKGESLEEALARVRRSIDGGCGDAADDSDSDLEVVADSVTFNLSCPMSGSRISTAGRFKPCTHMGGFDLNAFVELNQRTRKWQCPVCMKNYTLEHLIIDPFLNRIAQLMRDYNEDVKEVELKADGSWRPKLEGDATSREAWRKADGSIVMANGFHKVTPGPVKMEEGASPERVPLKIGIKRTRDGQWAVNRTRNSNNAAKKVERSFSRSSSATDSNNANGYDDERSVNQGPSTERTADNGLDFTMKKNKLEPPPTSAPEAVIVLSDSEDESGAPTRASPYGLAAKEPATVHHANGSSGPEVYGQASREEDDGWGQASVFLQHTPYRFLDPDAAATSSDYGLNQGDDDGMHNMVEYGPAEYLEDQGAEDPTESSLRLFLPPQPARAPLVQESVAVTARDDEALDHSWFSLSLGGGELHSQGGGPLRRRHAYPRLERVDSLGRPGYHDSLANTG